MGGYRWGIPRKEKLLATGAGRPVRSAASRATMRPIRTDRPSTRMVPPCPKPTTGPSTGPTGFPRPGVPPIRSTAEASRPRSRLSAAARSDARRRTSLPRPASTSRCSSRAGSRRRQAAALDRHRHSRAGTRLPQACEAARRARRPPHLSDRPTRLARVRRGASPPANRVRTAGSRCASLQLDLRRDRAAREGVSSAPRGGARGGRAERARRCSGRWARAALGSSRTATRASIPTGPRSDSRERRRRAAPNYSSSRRSRAFARCAGRVEIKTEGGTVTASKVVVASGYPTDDFKPLRRRFSRCDGYVVLTPELPAGAAARDDAAEASSSATRLRRITGCIGSGIACCFQEPIRRACPTAPRSGRSCSARAS